MQLQQGNGLPDFLPLNYQFISPQGHLNGAEEQISQKLAVMRPGKNIQMQQNQTLIAH